MKSGTLKSSPDAMLHVSPLKSIIIFGLPIILGSVFQQLYSMVDSIVSAIMRAREPLQLSAHQPLYATVL